MTPYLLGSSGALLGIIGALWFWRKATKAQGDLTLSKKTVADLNEKLTAAHAATEAALREHADTIDRHAKELVAKEAELAVHRKNEDALRDAVAKGGTKGLVELANSQYGPVSPTKPGG